jgi:predicted flap endonuclease-1-like 5' DNA nuclease
MSPFLVGLILLAGGLAGVFWGYRIFRVILPILGGFAGYLIAIVLFPDSWVLALAVGFGLALLFVLLAYTAWSLMVTISGVILGASLGAAIAAGLDLWNWLGWIIILGLAVVGGYLVWKIRDEVVIILTATAGAAFVATGLRIWFGEGTIRSFLWFVIFIVFALVGIAWQWRRYRHLKLLGMGGAAEVPGATRAAPAVDAGVPIAAATPVVEAAPAAAAVVAAGAVAAAEAEVEPEAEAPVVEAAAEAIEVAPAVAAVAAVAAMEEETPAEELEAPMTEMAAPVEERAAEVAADLDQLEASLDGAGLAAMQQKVNFVEGIGPVYGEKLNEAGIDMVMDLLKRGATRKGRAELVEATGIAAGLIMKWVNQADLYRVKGIGKQFGELLEAAGVDTVPELAQRNPVNLFNKLSEVNAEKKLAGRAPHQGEVESWVAQAKDLPRVIEY